METVVIAWEALPGAKPSEGRRATSLLTTALLTTKEAWKETAWVKLAANPEVQV